MLASLMLKQVVLCASIRDGCFFPDKVMSVITLGLCAAVMELRERPLDGSSVPYDGGVRR